MTIKVKPHEAIYGVRLHEAVVIMLAMTGR